MSRPATQHKRAAYPVYRPSGIEWLGEIPEHWEVKRLKFVANTVMGQSPNSDDYTFEESDRPFLQGNAEFGVENPTAKYYCETATKTAPAGSLLVSVRAPVGTLNMADRCYGIGRGLCAVIPDQSLLISRFAWHTLTVTRHELWCIATGSTYEAVSADEVADMTVPIPPLTEQRAIAAFLDRETTRIDALIEKKRRQIELLQEKRSALISHAVTKGLDPNAKMKDSGIEWLGEIPEHWEVLKLKYIASVQFSNVDKNSVEGEETVRLCNYVDVYNNDFITGDLPFMSATATKGEIRKFRVRRGDVIITKDSESWTDIAVPSYVSDKLDDVLCGYHLAQIRANTRLMECKYLFRAFSSKPINHQFQVASTGITRYGLGNYWLDNGLFLIPPLEEQLTIAAFLDRETARIDALIEKVEKSIELLREYRTALISAAVTGKIDVRDSIEQRPKQFKRG